MRAQKGVISKSLLAHKAKLQWSHGAAERLEPEKSVVCTISVCEMHVRTGRLPEKYKASKTKTCGQTTAISNIVGMRKGS